MDVDAAALEDETQYGLLGQSRPALDLLRTQVPGDRLGALYSGARFEGEQRSGIHSYRVVVHIQHVDLAASFLCGYLHIHGLTADYPELTTFFEAELVGRHHSFLTRKWEAGEEVDRKHWIKFQAFKNFERTFNRDDFHYDFHGQDFVFMRWKEHFLVPDHRVQSIHGASFAGFYYICYQISSGTITGFYYHRNSEWFQNLSLQHRPELSSATYELC
ncbi:vacuolar import and degradation protein-domain-containing protein [Thamnocephalis sphaerospora]|uniref:Vacuolar import and degradation protein-domain-containing protein n=1 Tax=Thamnocephalis sphaerospora TaxID=78915 RepID=A0A4P9XHT3_9FUNG|nr:vacuolar import and degradation protein-domain-containing protein [Thamnocephalis sphaerospora]|eukprot:RKP04861.1 vacuolar import and degradation protein-domain-containing protein [Thamnocephalis sphaerospora]